MTEVWMALRYTAIHSMMKKERAQKNIVYILKKKQIHSHLPRLCTSILAPHRPHPPPPWTWHESCMGGTVCELYSFHSAPVLLTSLPPLLNFRLSFPQGMDLSFQWVLVPHLNASMESWGGGEWERKVSATPPNAHEGPILCYFPTCFLTLLCNRPDMLMMLI